MKLCVIGDPVGHSMSPVLHRRMLALSGIEGDYQAVTVTRETLPDFMAAGRAGEWDGCNVTMPLKQEVIRYLDQLSPEAEACGAVNTVCFRNGHTVGYNTDAPGIRAGFAARGAAPTGRLVIGNGGAARAARCPGRPVRHHCRPPRRRRDHGRAAPGRPAVPGGGQCHPPGHGGLPAVCGSVLPGQPSRRRGGV